MQQHNAIKASYPDAVLLVPWGWGFFMKRFNADGSYRVRISQALFSPKRANGSPLLMYDLAGFPHHSLDTYLHKLVKAGHRVAICDQLEDPKR